jgi:ribosomal protein S18 acetylase RimI-like enzyme
VTDDVLEACHRLIPQLSSSSSPITRAQLDEIITGSSTVLFAARSEGAIVGLLTLAVFRIPTAVRAWIEDVVVDERARGKGVGEALSRAALAEAAQRGAKTVDLTSRPSREAANRLYQRIGFVRRDTNVYRYER